ncbi:isocitrate dehydrogenase (NADP(+)) [Desulfatiglans anilini]|uniref:isocitrate dehydrogenase (NADP(+)) n=1 Tax=Desulfatiglans anilini TaxID=90728 RepID=UPI00041E69F9|nr:isocitrate dehydrogenase (NADP(+)) [Desulfatiglans anilini]
MPSDRLETPTTGNTITWDSHGRPIVPDTPIIPFIEGDGTGPDIWRAARPVIDAAVRKTYGGKKAILWLELLAGAKAQDALGCECLLPEETLEALTRYGIAIKGPLTTPVGGGFRSLNVTLRQRLDLYACIRPVRYVPGIPAPVRHPEKVDLVIFRENTEDVYAGVEWEAESPAAREILEQINARLSFEGKPLLPIDSAVGIKPMSRRNTQRLVARAIQYAADHHYDSVTLVHKGNIMKYTEGAFRDWGYQTAREMFGDLTLTEEELFADFGGKAPAGRIVIKDRIADAMFQQLLLRPEEYGVLATPNLNGDYLSDAAAAQVGGLGMAPGANVGDRCAVFEATHGSAPKYAGLDKVNPGSLILSGVEMLRFMGWDEAADLILKGLRDTIGDGIVTYDLARQMENAKEVSCSAFGAAIQSRMG